MQYELSQADISNRVQMLINKHFNGNMAEMGRACQQYNKRIGRGHISSIIDRGSMPRLDIVAVIALAAGVSLDWLAGIKTPHPEEPNGATLEGQARGASVQFETVPSQAITLPGFAIGAPGNEQLIVDFLVLGKNDRRVIPFGEHVADRDEYGG